MAKESNNVFKKFLKCSPVEKVVLILFFLFFLAEAVIHVFPLLYVLNNSLKTAEELNESMLSGNPFALTKTWSFSNYGLMLKYFQVRGGKYFETMLWNSLWQSGLFLFANLGASVIIGYILARYNFPGKAIVFSVLIFKQAIPIMGTEAASYKLLDALGMINNPSTIWLFWINGFDYSAFILYGTFKSISMSYSESAKIDGASNSKIFFDIIMPMAFPSVVALLVTNFVSVWNNYSISMITLSRYPTLAYGTFIFQQEYLHLNHGETVLYTALVAAALPGVILYLSMQNIIVKNLSVGGLKG